MRVAPGRSRTNPPPPRPPDVLAPRRVAYAAVKVALPAVAAMLVFIFPALRWLCVQADALRTWIMQ